MSQHRTTVVALLGLFAVGCRALDDEVPAPDLDRAYFRCHVQPVLVKSCAQLACHGDAARFFRVFGRNRLRYGLAPEQRNEPLTEGELAHNFAAAAAFVDRDAPSRSLLLQKPLDQAKTYHGGATEYGQGNVFLDDTEPDFQALRAWAEGATDDPGCLAPGEKMP